MPSKITGKIKKRTLHYSDFLSPKNFTKATYVSETRYFRKDKPAPEIVYDPKNDPWSESNVKEKASKELNLERELIVYDNLFNRFVFERWQLVNQHLCHNLHYKKYKFFDVTEFAFVLPTFWLIQQSFSRLKC